MLFSTHLHLNARLHSIQILTATQLISFIYSSLQVEVVLGKIPTSTQSKVREFLIAKNLFLGKQNLEQKLL